MPRSPRQDFEGARHHVMNRASRHDDLFVDDATCARFLEIVADVPERFGARIHGFAMMPNHYHLLIEVPQGNLSAIMRHIGGVFTQSYNREHRHDGPVFRGRYRNLIVQDDAYWMHLLAYLHLNPVRARLAKNAEDCIWTSHNAYLKGELAPDWLYRDEMLRLFGSPDAIDTYISGVRKGRLDAPSSFDANKLWTAPSTEAVPEAPVRSPRTVKDALDDVVSVTGVSKAKIRTLSRGRTPNRTAWLTVWWLLRGAGLTQGEVGKVMGVSRTRVSQLRVKFLRLAGDDAEVAGWRDALLKRLN